MAREALNNIFKTEKKITRLVEVVQRISKTKYQVKDSSGRMFVAGVGDAAFFPPGASVVMQDDQIVRSGRRLSKIRRVEV